MRRIFFLVMLSFFCGNFFAQIQLETTLTNLADALDVLKDNLQGKSTKKTSKELTLPEPAQGNFWIVIDGDKPYQVAKKTIENSGTLTTMLEDVDLLGSKKELYVPNISDAVWKDVVQPALTAGNKYVLKALGGVESYVDVINAAHYLDMLYLRKQAVHELVPVIKNTITLLEKHPDAFQSLKKLSPDVFKIISQQLINTYAYISTLPDAVIAHDGFSLAWSPDSTLLAAASEKRTVRVWDLSHGFKNIQEKVLEGHTNTVVAVAFSPDGTMLISGQASLANNDATLYIWDMSQGMHKINVVKKIIGHKESITSLAISPDGSTLVSSSWDGTVRFWDLSKGANNISEIKTLYKVNMSGQVVQHPRSVMYSSDGGLLFVGMSHGTIDIWNISQGVQQAVRAATLVAGDADWIESLAFSFDRRLLASGRDNGTLTLWDMSQGLQNVKVATTLSGHTDRISGIEFVSQGSVLFSGSFDGAVKIWTITPDVKKSSLVTTLKGSGRIKSLVVSPSDTVLVAGTMDNKISLWNIPNMFENLTVEQTLFMSLAEHIKTLNTKDPIYSTFTTEQKNVMGKRFSIK